VALLKRQEDFIGESGTTETVIKVTGHALKAGDRLRNTKYDKITEVLEVIDANTVRVASVGGQSAGNKFEVYINTGTVTAEE
jgi:cyanophycinase-like exopeptidase